MIRPDLRQELMLLALALLALVVFGVGYSVGQRDETFHTDWVKPLHGLAGANGAVGTIQGGTPDANGNTPLLLTVRGLRPLHKAERYILYLTRDGKRFSSCGEFKARATTTRVRLSAPGTLTYRDGWEVVRAELDDRTVEKPLLRTARATG